MSRNLALTLSTVCALNLQPALAQASPAPATLAVGTAVPETLANVDVIDGAALKKAGATKLSVFFVEGADGSDGKTAFLLGTKAGKIVWKAPLPLKQEINRAKTDVICRKGQIHIISQFPGCAAYVNQIFSWDGVKAILVKTISGDPSQDEVNKLTAYAASGTRAQLDAWEEKEHNVFYPGNYINQDNLEKLLKGGQKAAQVLDKAGKPALAAARMELCFDAGQDLVELVSGGSEETKTPAKWIGAWQADCIDMPAAKWTPMMKDYAQYLEKCGKKKQAQSVLEAMNKATTSTTANAGEAK